MEWFRIRTVEWITVWRNCKVELGGGGAEAAEERWRWRKRRGRDRERVLDSVKHHLSEEEPFTENPSGIYSLPIFSI